MRDANVDCGLFEYCAVAGNRCIYWFFRACPAGPDDNTCYSSICENCPVNPACLTTTPPPTTTVTTSTTLTTTTPTPPCSRDCQAAVLLKCVPRVLRCKGNYATTGGM